MKEAAVCVIQRGNEILLLHRSPDDKLQGWCLPGGKLEDDEDGFAACIREVEEETGIYVNYAYYVDTKKSSNGFRTHIFVRKLEIGEEVEDLIMNGEITLSSEHDDFKWVEIDDLANLTLAGNTMEFIEAVLEVN